MNASQVFGYGDRTRALVIVYEIDPRMKNLRRVAVEDAYTAFKIDASIAMTDRRPHAARRAAQQCRALLGAFGVRRAQRLEISSERRAQIYAECAERRLAGAGAA